MPRKKKDAERPVVSYAHTDKERLNNPPAGLVTAEPAIAAAYNR